MTIDQIQLWESAASAFDARHQLIQPDHLALSTPCSDFDVPVQILQPATDGVEAFPEPCPAERFGGSVAAGGAASAQDRMLVVAGRQP